MQIEDAELVSRSKSGDLAAFNLLVERYQRQVYGVSARVLGDLPAAEDVTQEAFISAYRAIGKFRGGSLRAWLMRIATNLCYDHLRAAKRRPEDSLERSMESPGFSPPRSAGSPEGDVLRGELRVALEQAIGGLPVDQRTVLVLVDVQGLSYEEAAQAAGVSIGTVKSRMNRARGRVRDLLMRNRELLPDPFRHRAGGGHQ